VRIRCGCIRGLHEVVAVALHQDQPIKIDLDTNTLAKSIGDSIMSITMVIFKENNALLADLVAIKNRPAYRASTE